jgi:hypothetical protein
MLPTVNPIEAKIIMNNRLSLAFTLFMGVAQAGAAVPDVMMLGFHVHDPMNIPSAASIGYKTIRLWDTGTDWASLEPEPDVWQFNSIDKYLTQSEKANLKVLWTLGLTPQWASARSDEVCSYGLGCAAKPGNINNWRSYVHTIATKYKGRIECYEPWNEVSFPYDSQFSNGAGGDYRFFSGNVSDMVALTQVAYKEIKQADPNACVLSPSFHPSGNWAETLDRFISQGGGQYMDVLSQHYYFDPEPESIIPAIRSIKAVMVKNGLGNMPIWNTEVGQSFFEDAKLRKTIPVQDLIYSLTLRTSLINVSEGVSRVYWYAWDNNGMGVFDPKTHANLGGAASSAAVHLLDNLTSVTCSSANNVWQCKIQTTTSKFKVAWLRGINATPRSFVLTGNATRWGKVQQSFLAGQTIKLDERPVVINGW